MRKMTKQYFRQRLMAEFLGELKGATVGVRVVGDSALKTWPRFFNKSKKEKLFY